MRCRRRRVGSLPALGVVCLRLRLGNVGPRRLVGLEDGVVVVVLVVRVVLVVDRLLRTFKRIHWVL
jgi:hypothetical protein